MGGRIRLFPGGETAFYKSVFFEEIDFAMEKAKNNPHVLMWDTQSNLVAASFLTSKACKGVTKATGVRIPRCYDAQAVPDYDNPVKSKFSFLFEDFDPINWYQIWLLDDDKLCKSSLKALARIHAYFWEGSTFWNDADAAKELEEAIWKSGSHGQPLVQNTCSAVAKEWKIKREKFRKELSTFGYWDDLGERLESVAEECGRLAHPFADDSTAESYKKYRT